MPTMAPPPPPPASALILHPTLQRPPLPPPTACFDDVPLDILRLIGAELAASGTARDMAAFESVCTATRSVVEDAVCWKRLVSRSFPAARLPAGGGGARAGGPRPNWKRLYEFHSKLLRCLVRGGSPSRGPTYTRLAPGAVFVALPALPAGQLAAV